MTRLVLHTDAIEDLIAIRDSGAIADFGVIVAFLQQAKQDMALLEQTYYLLGVPPREIAYDEHHPRTQRLIAAYDKLRLR